MIALAFMANAALGVYHSGVEWKWWAGPSECSGGSTIRIGEGGVDIENAKIIACDQRRGASSGSPLRGGCGSFGAARVIAAWGAAQKR